jgi:ribosomal protein S18 acetylase RimI-like enzyme
MTMLDVTIRALLPQDLITLDIIEKTCFGPAGLPKSELEELSKDPNATILVACLGRVIVGFVIYEFGSKGRSVMLSRVVVHPIVRRKGVASQLVRRVLNLMQPAYQLQLQADVPETNLAAQLLLRCHGFKAMRICRGHTEEDTSYLFEYQPAVAHRPHSKTISAVLK